MSNPVIKEAMNYELMFAKDDKLCRQYEAVEKARRDQNARINSAERRGEKRGVAINRRNNIINGLKSGIDINIIAQITQADIDTINNIKQELNL